MLNKDKRSLLLALSIGDGCLHYIRNNGKIYGGLTIDHGIEQSDYQSWKAKLLSDIMNKPVNMRTGHNGQSVQVSICMKRIRAWRKFCYPNNKKDISKILPFIRHPEFTLAVWLMDDGYVETNGNRKGGRFRLFVCDQKEESLNKMILWFQKEFDVTPIIKFQKTNNKQYPFLKFNQVDSLKLWKPMRDFVLQFRSMKKKFRYIENTYQFQLAQRTPEKSDDIVGTNSNIGN
jgi:hypothetical protein